MGANATAQASVVFIQLLALPAYLHTWNAQQYGTWLMLSGVPTYLALFDGGLLTAAGNAAARQFALGNYQAAKEILHSATAASIGLAAAVLAICCLALLAIDISWLNEHKLTIAILSASALLSQASLLPDMIFRMTGNYALGTNIQTATRIAEFAAQITAATLFESFESVATAGVVARIGCLGIAISLCARFRDQITFGFSSASRKELRNLISPALHYFAFPIAGAISFQGTTIALGSICGPASIVAFSMCRTVSRVMVQVIGILSNALSPEFALGISKAGETQQLKRLFQRSQKLTFASIVVLAIVLTFAFDQLLSIWSNGEITASKDLQIAAILYAAASATMLVARNLLIAQDMHANVSRVTLGSALLSVLLGSFAANYFQAPGMMFACATVEVCIALATILEANKFIRDIDQGR